MSSKNCSLAIDEVKAQSRKKHIDVDFEPELKVLINKRLINSFATVALENTDAVKITGKISISF